MGQRKPTDPVQTLKTLIRQELDKEAPIFGLLTTYLQALRDTMAVTRLSLDEAENDHCSEDGRGKVKYTVNTGGGIHLANEFIPNRKSESMQDHAIAAMAQMADRAGYDPLAVIVQALPTIDTLYDENERKAIRAALKAEIGARLFKSGLTGTIYPKGEDPDQGNGQEEGVWPPGTLIAHQGTAAAAIQSKVNSR